MVYRTYQDRFGLPQPWKPTTPEEAHRQMIEKYYAKQQEIQEEKELEKAMELEVEKALDKALEKALDNLFKDFNK